MAPHTTPLFAFAFEGIGPALNGVVLIALLLFALIGLGLLVVLAALPGRIAAQRGHPRAEAVRMAGWLGLPTGIGWVVAMVWAYASPSLVVATSPESSEMERRLASLEAALDELDRKLPEVAK